MLEGTTMAEAATTMAATPVEGLTAEAVPTTVATPVEGLTVEAVPTTVDTTAEEVTEEAATTTTIPVMGASTEATNLLRPPTTKSTMENN